MKLDTFRKSLEEAGFSSREVQLMMDELAKDEYYRIINSLNYPRKQKDAPEGVSSLRNIWVGDSTYLPNEE